MTNTILGIDYGRKRIGVAVARDGAIDRLVTLENHPEIVNELVALAHSHQASEVVLGLPRTIDGNDTDWTAEVRNFADQLKSQIKVVLQDEFATSDAARERLQLTGLSPKEQGALVDQEAAALLLEDYVQTT